MKIEDALKTNNFRTEQHKVLLNLLFTGYWLKDKLFQSLKESDLTVEQYNVLRILRGAIPKELCVKDIAARMIEKNSNVPRILERLQRKTLIERKPAQYDRRETVTIITPCALDLLEKLDQLMIENEEKFIALNDEDAAKLNQILEQMRGKY